MKKIVFLVAVLLTAQLMASPIQAQFSSANLQASGLTCALCTRAINKSLEQLPFVAAVQTDIKTSSFQISFKESGHVDPDALRKAVEDAGFSVARLQLKGNFSGVAAKNDSHVLIAGRTFHFLKVKDQVLQGEQTLTLVDKNFVTAKEFSKYKSATSLQCIESGRASHCCSRDGVQANARIYHVTI